MIIGTCSLCGGPVESPDTWLGTLPAPVTCKSCGAVKPQYGPVIDMHLPVLPEGKPAPQPWFDATKSVFGPATSGKIPPNQGQTVSSTTPNHVFAAPREKLKEGHRPYYHQKNYIRPAVRSEDVYSWSGLGRHYWDL